MMDRNEEHTLRYFLFLAAAWSAALPCQAQGDVEPAVAAPFELRLEIRPRICERGVNANHCQLEFSVRGARAGQEICLYMDDGEERLLACKSADGAWRHKAALPLTRSTRFFIRTGPGSASGAEAQVELASYVPPSVPGDAMPGSASDDKLLGHLLLVEDDTRLAELIARFLGENGFLVDLAHNGAEALRRLREQAYDFIICDLMLPDTHGFHLMERVRLDANTPFLFLTAVDAKELQISGFELGAVDYVIKPVDPDVLLARLRSHMNRLAPRENSDQRRLSFDNFWLDKATRECRAGPHVLRLSEHEFSLLWLLAKYHGTVLTRDFLFNSGTNREYDGLDRTIGGRISRLRKKLDAVPGCPYEVRTIWGKGYMFCERSRPAS